MDGRFRFETTIETRGPALSETSDNLLQWLRASLDDALARRLVIGVQEMLRNAFEHGNLRIGSSEKEHLLERGEFERELELRSALARADGLTIWLRAELADGVFTCTVRDQGPGFGVKEARGAICPTMLGGRGLELIKSTFDEIAWSESGNEITVKRVIRPA